MFYYPNRTQAKRIQATLETLYKGLNGQYYYGDSAWKFINEFTGVDLLAIIERIAREKLKMLHNTVLLGDCLDHLKKFLKTQWI